MSPRKADILLNTACFSTTGSDFKYFASQNHSLPWTSKPTDPPDPTDLQNPEVAAMLQKKEAKSRYIHPTFPPATFLTTLIQQERFEEYIANEFPSLNLCPPLPASTTTYEPLHKEVNATAANSLLNAVASTTLQVGATEWVCKAIFPDEFLPVAFNDACLDNVPECWDKSRQRFSNLPEIMGEQAVQDWLNHLAHTLGVQHGLIKEKEPEELLSACDDEDIDVDSGTEKKGFVIAGAEDRSFSMVAHKKAPSGGYRLRKPDIILINRNLRHFLKDGDRRPRWHQVEAIVEVSVSAPRESMLQQIFEKAALMFESQPFRRFAIGLVLRGATSNNTAEFSFVLVDRAGVCRTNWAPISGYDALNLTRIVFALSYIKPKFLGVDTSMTVDLLSGNVTKIKVKDQEFNVIKHIYSSLVLFGRGTHVFLVQDKDGKSHILKDAWLLADHGISEIDILSTISNTLKNDPSINAQKYRSMHPRFVVGEEMGDSTNTQRGRLAGVPPERLHRRVVTGPVGDPLTSFRSCEEFIQVLLDCVDCKSSVQYQSHLLIQLLFRA